MSETIQAGAPVGNRNAAGTHNPADLSNIADGKSDLAYQSNDLILHRAAAQAHMDAHNAHMAASLEHRRSGNKMAAFESQKVASKHADAAMAHAGKAQVKGSEMFQSNENIIQCRAAVGVKIPASETWTPGAPVRFIYAPDGLHTLTAGFRKNETITISVLVDPETAPVLQDSFDHLTATNPKQEPYGDEDHESKKATLRFPAGKVTFVHGTLKGDTGIIISGGEPTGYGAKSVNDKDYRAWSPEFGTDADMAQAVFNEDSKHWTFPDGVRGSESNPARLNNVNFVIGALTNRPAFRAMPPVKARHAEMDGHDTVKAMWSDAAREAALAVRKREAELEPVVGPLKTHAHKLYNIRGNKYGSMTPQRDLEHKIGEATDLLAEHAESGEWMTEEAHKEAGHARSYLESLSDDRAKKTLELYSRTPASSLSQKYGSNDFPSHWSKPSYYVSPETGKQISGHVDDPETMKNWHPTKATDSTTTDTIQATWSDAAREASAEARRASSEAHGMTATANQASLLTGIIRSSDAILKDLAATRDEAKAVLATLKAPDRPIETPKPRTANKPKTGVDMLAELKASQEARASGKRGAELLKALKEEKLAASQADSYK